MLSANPVISALRVNTIHEQLRINKCKAKILGCCVDAQLHWDSVITYTK